MRKYYGFIISDDVMSKVFFITLFCLVFFQGLSFCQPDNLDSTKLNVEKILTNETRNFFIYTSIGVPEMITVGLGYQLNENISSSILGGIVMLKGGVYFPRLTRSAGLEYSYHTDRKIFLFNKISIQYRVFFYDPESQVLQRSDYPLLYGDYLEVCIGNEETKKGVNLFWSIGYCYNSIRGDISDNGSYTLFSVKLGLNCNLIF